jgi:site-specific DNA-adenine methylase
MKWAGNKLRHYERIRKLIEKSGRRIVLDPFLGSGSVVVRLILDNAIDHAIVSDSLCVMPRILTALEKRTQFDVDDYEKITFEYKGFRNLRRESDYYVMRDDWNEQFVTNDIVNKSTIAMFHLLTYMCFNSFIQFQDKFFSSAYSGGNAGTSGTFRFNKKLGGDKFFFGHKSVRTKRFFPKYADYMNEVSLACSKISAKCIDFREALSHHINDIDKYFVILDPPYTRGNQYGNDWTYEDQHDFANHVGQLIESNAAFACFCHIEREDAKSDEYLIEVLKKYRKSLRIVQIKKRIAKNKKFHMPIIEAIIYPRRLYD